MDLRCRIPRISAVLYEEARLGARVESGGLVEENNLHGIQMRLLEGNPAVVEDQ